MFCSLFVLCLCLEMSILRLFVLCSLGEAGRVGEGTRPRGARVSTVRARAPLYLRAAARAVPLYRSSHLHAHIYALVIDFNAFYCGFVTENAYLSVYGR